QFVVIKFNGVFVAKLPSLCVTLSVLADFLGMSSVKLRAGFSSWYKLPKCESKLAMFQISTDNISFLCDFMVILATWYSFLLLNTIHYLFRLSLDGIGR
ncbi:hypothetical protein GLOIN_2v1628337, partial [Rhizophagus irregularis DAOM 181602=DAOM 197198]